MVRDRGDDPLRIERRHRGAKITAQRVAIQVLALSCWLWATGSAAAASESPVAQGRCAIEFLAASTLHDFSGKVEARPFELTRHGVASTGQEWWSGSVEVAVAEMSTGIGRRDRNMRAMFEADVFPSIVADFPHVASAEFAGARSGDRARLGFNLRIREVTQPIEASVSHWIENADGASFDAEFDVSLASFGLVVPPVLGLLRVDDVVHVRAHVMLGVSPEEEAAKIGSAQPPGSSTSAS